MKKHKSFPLVLSAVLAMSALSFPAQQVTAYDKTVTFAQLSPAVNGGEPVRGVDISSILAIEDAGVTFRDDAGDPVDLFRILAEHGVNYIRVRVWNQPDDGMGHSYGGGNNDVAVAAEIGRRAATHGMKLLVDFHYSDFWADPEKQHPPKAWNGYSVSEKGAAIYDFTLKSLQTIREAGADIGMVQVGNETNAVFCGEDDMYEICKLFTAGCNAVRDFDPAILRVLHFADPSTGYYDWYAKVLNECSVDYDVFATSYYPYWHGTADNMSSVLKKIADSYGKYVMVAETAYPYTNEDGDTFGNVVSAASPNATFRYEISVEGQAECLTDVFQAVADVGEKGIGAFYWEPAWLGVPDISWEEQNKLWETHGSGWATGYAGGYDSSATKTGGSSYDNQALFDFYGKPLESLEVFSRIYPQVYRYAPENAALLKNGSYTLQNLGSHLYLNADIAGNVIQSETEAVWHLTSRSDGSYDLSYGDKRLIISDTADGGSSVRLGDRANSLRIAETGSGYVLFTGEDTCLDVFDRSISAGAWVTYSKSLLAESQQFVLKLVEEDVLPTEPAAPPPTQSPTTHPLSPPTEPFLPPTISPTEHAEHLPGDVYQDNAVNLTDVILLQKYLLGVEKINAVQGKAADLNADGIVDVLDLVLLKRIIIGQEVKP